MTITRPVTRGLSPPPNGRAAPPPAAPKKTFNRTRGIVADASRAVLIYGVGGIGKTSLAAMAPTPLFIDLGMESRQVNVDRIDNIETWAELRSFIQTGDFTGVKTIVIDNGSVAEEMCRRHVVENVKTDKQHAVTSIEGYGWGKGYVYLFEEWRKLLGDLNRHRPFRNVVLVCHEHLGKVPNPNGDDYIRYEPRLYHGSQASLLHATKEWVDEVWFLSYDVSASEGKAKGNGSRSIYVTEQATHMAKTRSLDGRPIVYTSNTDNTIWNNLLAAPAVVDDIPPAE